MDKKKRLFAGVLCLVMIFMATAPILAASDNAKEEVVYASLGSDGEVNSLSIVNIFSKGAKEDYGSYTKVKALNSEASVKMAEDKITFASDKDRFYYQGDMDDKTLPWLISVKYYIDGKEMSAKEIKGKSGEAEIKLSIKENPAMDKEFFEKYTLEVSTKLDTKKFKNISSDKASLANEGEMKLINFIALPNTGLEASINADVEDFSFEGFSINCLDLKLNIDLESLGLEEKADDLKSASQKLKDASYKINKNTKPLANGARDIKASYDKLEGANRAYIEKSVEVFDGVAKLDAGLEAIDAKSDELKVASKSVEDGLDKIALLAQNDKNMAAAIAMIKESYKAFDAGLNEYVGGVSSAAKSSKTLNAGANAMSAKANELISANSSMTKGMASFTKSLSDYLVATDKITTGFTKLYDEIKSEENEVKDKFVKNDSAKTYVKSFASEKNENVRSVQFVLKTEKVEEEVKEEVHEKKVDEKKNVFKKFTELFSK